MNRLEPLDTGFNVAVLHIADRLYPGGFDVGPVAPCTLESLREHVRQTGRMLVWDGASEATIYGDPEVNFAFRAWHDWAHYRHDLPFDFRGEVRAAKVQIDQLIELYGRTERTADWVAILLAEVVGQAQALVETGTFPTDQRAFTESKLPLWRAAARRIVLGEA